MGRRGRPPNGGAPADQDDMLRCLDALRRPGQVQDRATHAAHLREVKSKYKAEEIEAARVRERQKHDDEVRLVAAAGGLHVSQRGSAKTQQGNAVHGRAWTIPQILRAAFVPSSTTSVATILECGAGGPRDARSVTAGAVLANQDQGSQEHSNKKTYTNKPKDCRSYSNLAAGLHGASS